ncbi:MAG: winged helix-turn-helix domain-containing protein [Synechococcales cyanobacterium M58_A2018_015]|nr:winged helix-turn-helix domain-containing protein [Synechococcales cyanobacterium M58_A2018_015]
MAVSTRAALERGGAVNPCRLLLWGYDFFSSSHMIEVHVSYLRLKLEAHSAN